MAPPGPDSCRLSAKDNVALHMLLLVAQMMYAALFMCRLHHVMSMAVCMAWRGAACVAWPASCIAKHPVAQRQSCVVVCCLALVQAYMEYMPITTPSGASTSNSSSGSSSSNGSSSNDAICSGLADIYRVFTFGTTMTLVRQSEWCAGIEPCEHQAKGHVTCQAGNTPLLMSSGPAAAASDDQCMTFVLKPVKKVVHPIMAARPGPSAPEYCWNRSDCSWAPAVAIGPRGGRVPHVPPDTHH
jgi:hypothetical protein